MVFTKNQVYEMLFKFYKAHRARSKKEPNMFLGCPYQYSKPGRNKNSNHQWSCSDVCGQVPEIFKYKGTDVKFDCPCFDFENSWEAIKHLGKVLKNKGIINERATIFKKPKER